MKINVEINLSKEEINFLDSYRLKCFMNTNLWLRDYGEVIESIIADYFNSRGLW